jgi:hypothetical protein
MLGRLMARALIIQSMLVARTARALLAAGGACLLRA